MNESNISRDHIALEAMKIFYKTVLFRRLSIINRIRKFFGMPVPCIGVTTWSYEKIAEQAYKMADAMINEREKY